MRKSVCSLFLFALLVLFGVLLYTRSAEAAKQTYSAVERCLNTVIPSLYGFMLFSGLFTASGAYCVPAALLSLPARLFGMSGAELTVFLISQLGGYPVGAVMLLAMEKRGDISAQRRRILAPMCCGAGAFTLAVCPRGCFPLYVTLAPLMLSCFASNLLLLLINIPKMKKTADSGFFHFRDINQQKK